MTSCCHEMPLPLHPVATELLLCIAIQVFGAQCDRIDALIN